MALRRGWVGRGPRPANGPPRPRRSTAAASPAAQQRRSDERVSDGVGRGYVVTAAPASPFQRDPPLSVAKSECHHINGRRPRKQCVDCVFFVCVCATGTVRPCLAERAARPRLESDPPAPP